MPSLINIWLAISTTAAVIFAVLYFKNDKYTKEERAETITDYEHRLVKVEQAVELEKQFTEIFLKEHPLLSPELKKLLIADYKIGKGRTKINSLS